MNSQRLPSLSSRSSLRLQDGGGKSKQHRQFLVTAPSKPEGRSSPDARGASVAAAAAPRRTSIPYRWLWGPPQAPDEMRGRAACPGGARVTVASGPRADGRTRAQAVPCGSPARFPAPTRAAPQHLGPCGAGTRRSWKPKTCQPHSPGYLQRSR